MYAFSESGTVWPSESGERNNYQQLFKALDDDFDFFEQLDAAGLKPAADYCLNAELKFLSKEYDSALKILKDKNDVLEEKEEISISRCKKG